MVHIDVEGRVRYIEKYGRKFVRFTLRRKDRENWNGVDYYIYIGLGKDVNPKTKEEIDTIWVYPPEGEIRIRRDLDDAEREEKEKAKKRRKKIS